jgi:hypothetical protein
LTPTLTSLQIGISFFNEFRTRGGFANPICGKVRVMDCVNFSQIGNFFSAAPATVIVCHWLFVILFTALDGSVRIVECLPDCALDSLQCFVEVLGVHDGQMVNGLSSNGPSGAQTFGTPAIFEPKSVVAMQRRRQKFGTPENLNPLVSPGSALSFIDVKPWWARNFLKNSFSESRSKSRSLWTRV